MDNWEKGRHIPSPTFSVPKSYTVYSGGSKIFIKRLQIRIVPKTWSWNLKGWVLNSSTIKSTSNLTFRRLNINIETYHWQPLGPLLPAQQPKYQTNVSIHYTLLKLVFGTKENVFHKKWSSRKYSYLFFNVDK